MALTSPAPAPIGVVVRALAELGCENEATRATLLKSMGWPLAVAIASPVPPPVFLKPPPPHPPSPPSPPAKANRTLPSTLTTLATTQPEEPDWLTNSKPLPLPDPRHAVPLFEKPIEPLFPPLITRAILTRLAAVPAPVGEVDVAGLVETVAKGQPLTTLPRRRVLTLAKGLDLLIDNGRGMDPFSKDIAGLVDDLALAVGRDRLAIRIFRSCPSLGVMDLATAAMTPHRPPPAGTPVLVVTDLGIGDLRSRSIPVPEKDWLGFAGELRSRSSPLAVLTPCSRTRAPPALRRSLNLITWDRRTGARLTDRSRSDAKSAEDGGGAARLACLASLAGRIDPQLIRALRLRLAVDLGVEAEADLWFSDLVQSAAITGAVLHPEDQRRLQDQLAATKGDLLSRAWEILFRLRTDRPWSERERVPDRSWLVAQEELTYWALKGLRHQGAERAAAEARLKQILKTMIAAAGSEREHDAVAWTKAARLRLPPAVLALQPMQDLLLGAALRGAETLALPALAEAVQSGVPGYLVPRDQPSRMSVWLRLVEGGIEAALHPLPEAHRIDSVALEPLLLVLSWAAAGTSQRSDILLNPPHQAFVALEADQVKIATPDGSRFQISREEPVVSADDGEQQWRFTVFVVGEGGVGKTSLVRALRGEGYTHTESATHGIATHQLMMPHPERDDVQMTLSVWDFGGAEIYHATHQFFIYDRALFLLVWNTRAGYEQCRVMQWLETINALAPSSPIVIVATHADTRAPDLPLGLIRAKYKMVIGNCIVSNLTRLGMSELFHVVAKSASTLPWMGERWPKTWVKAADAIRISEKRYVTLDDFRKALLSNGVSELSWPQLAQRMNELRDILYLSTYEDLKDTVIIKPQWMSSYIIEVLESSAVFMNSGIFTREEMERLWADLSPHMRSYLLALMEHFDISYRILEDRDISVIVDRLPLDPPDYMSRWEEIKQEPQISMRFRLNSMPAGIPTWFIARSHRFTTRTHWRTGALFAYGPEQRHLKYTPEETHLALVQAHPYERCVELSVRGPNPQGFFSVLKDGFEVTLSRFPGLKIERKIPCPGHQGNKCSHEFDYIQLLKRHERNRSTIECPEGMESVSVSELLFGLHWSTNDDVLRRLDDLMYGHGTSERELTDIRQEINDLRELVQLGFTNAFRRDQAKIESYCPNVFVLRPYDRARVLERLTSGVFSREAWREPSWLDAIAGQRIDLKLYCQAPGCWHPVQEGGQYEISEPRKWMKVMGPYISGLGKVLKVAAPLVGPWMNIVDKQTYEKDFTDDVEFMIKVSEKVPDFGKQEKDRLVDNEGRIAEQETKVAKRAALRSLREFLDMRDPRHIWGNLRVVLTPEGHYLWLCEYHAKSYK